MNLLLDTHVWLWMVAQPDRLRPSTRALLEAAENDLFLSAASSWEMAIKYARGNLPLPEGPESFVPPRLVRDAVRPLPITHPHALRVAALPPHHRDPFDRLLVAQALVEGMSLVTADQALEVYGVPLVQA